MDAQSQDNCMMGVLAGAGGGIVNINLSAKPEDTWFNSVGKKDKAGMEYSSKSACIGVNRTDNPNKALKGLLRYVQKGDRKPPDAIKVGGIEYSKVRNYGGANAPIVSDNGEKYFLYQSSTIGASPLSAPVTDITLDEEPIVSGAGTVLTVDQEDTEEKTDRYGRVIEAGKETRPYGDMDQDLFIHLAGEDNLTGIDSFYVGKGSNEKRAKTDLLSKGATTYFPVDMNKSADGDCVFIGCSKYNPEEVNTSSTKYEMQYAVKDLLVVRTEDPKKSFEHKGRTYKLCSDTDLNSGGSGKAQYLYQTTDLIKDSSWDNKEMEKAYITKLAAAKYDRVPKDVADFKWENLLLKDGEWVNLNEGNFKYDNKAKEIVDSRLHVFVHRANNYVKPEGQITGGYCDEYLTYGDVYMKK
jgi:hypothetical protein